VAKSPEAKSLEVKSVDKTDTKSVSTSASSSASAVFYGDRADAKTLGACSKACCTDRKACSAKTCRAGT